MKTKRWVGSLFSIVVLGLISGARAHDPKTEAINELVRFIFMGNKQTVTHYILETPAFRQFSRRVIYGPATKSDELRLMLDELTLDEVHALRSRVDAILADTRLAHYHVNGTQRLRTVEQRQVDAAVSSHLADFEIAVTRRLITARGVQAYDASELAAIASDLKGAYQTGLTPKAHANAFGQQALPNRQLEVFAAKHAARPDFVTAVYQHEGLTLQTRWEDLFTFLSGKKFLRAPVNLETSHGFVIAEAYSGVRRLGSFFNARVLPESRGLRFEIDEALRQSIVTQYPELAVIDFSRIQTAEQAEALVQRFEALFGSPHVILVAPNPTALAEVTRNAFGVGQQGARLRPTGTNER